MHNLAYKAMVSLRYVRTIAIVWITLLVAPLWCQQSFTYPCSNQIQIKPLGGLLTFQNIWYLSNPKDSGSFTTFYIEAMNVSRKTIKQGTLQIDLLDSGGVSVEVLDFYFGNDYDRIRSNFGQSGADYSATKELKSLKRNHFVNMGSTTSLVLPHCPVAARVSNYYLQFSDQSWSGSKYPISRTARMVSKGVPRPPENLRGSFRLTVSVDADGHGSPSFPTGTSSEFKRWVESWWKDTLFHPALLNSIAAHSEDSYLFRVQPSDDLDLPKLISEGEKPTKVAVIKCSSSNTHCMLQVF